MGSQWILRGFLSVSEVLQGISGVPAVFEGVQVDYREHMEVSGANLRRCTRSYREVSVVFQWVSGCSSRVVPSDL